MSFSRLVKGTRAEGWECWQEQEYAELICHENAQRTNAPDTPEELVPPSPVAAAISPHSVRVLRCARFASPATHSPACKRSLLPPAPLATPVVVTVAVTVAVPVPVEAAPTPVAVVAAVAAAAPAPPPASAPASDSEGEIDAGDHTGAEETPSDSDDPPGNNQYSVEQIQQRRIEPHSGMYEYYVKWCTPSIGSARSCTPSYAPNFF